MCSCITYDIFIYPLQMSFVPFRSTLPPPPRALVYIYIYTTIKPAVIYRPCRLVLHVLLSHNPPNEGYY